MIFLNAKALRRWETALLIGLAAAMLWASALGGDQDALAEQVVRLHIVANSDSAEDQALKLKVRDEVLEYVTPMLEGMDRQAALKALKTALPDIAAAAAETVGQEGYTYPVTATIRQERFPTKRYDGFALPAGDYTALRLQIGAGDGHNWWCVVFPPLCMSSVEETAELDDRSRALITGETEGYVVKFRAMEFWEKLKERFA